MQQHYHELAAVSGLNHVELTPVSILQRTSQAYPDHPAVIYGDRHYSWKQFAERARLLASGLNKLGLSKGATVSMIAGNTPELMEAHYGVAMSGGVLNAINVRLDPETIAYILGHSDCQILICDSHYSGVVKQALSLMNARPRVVDIVDRQMAAPQGGGERLGDITYEDILTLADAADISNRMHINSMDINSMDINSIGMPDSEWDAITLNYTSGTSGRPKGVVCHHRGAYLMAMGTVAAWQLPKHPVYLYTVPLFHCNGWGHIWSVGIMGGTFICNRVISAEVIFGAIRQYNVSHFGAAPVILSLLVDAPKAIQYQPKHTLQVMTAGAPPPSKVLEKTAALGLNVTHVYGLTETYGHVVLCDWNPAWNDLSIAEQAEIKSRQGIRFPMLQDCRVIDVSTGKDVAADGKTMGEIVLRGNTTMKGYYKNPAATAEAFKDGWYHSADLAVVYPDGYIQIKDRLKDIIISGGENISSIEVESAIYKHPKVAAAAVVAKPHDKWGETPCAFVELKTAEQATEQDIIEFCKQHLAGFKRPKKVVFMELPKTSTGKIQKFSLRQIINNGEV